MPEGSKYAVTFQKIAEVAHNPIGAEWRSHFSHRVEHGNVFIIQVSNGECHRVGAAAARIDKRDVSSIFSWRQFMSIDSGALFNHFATDE